MKPVLLLSLLLTVPRIATSVPGADSPIAVSIAVPHHGTERVVGSGSYGRDPHFHVIVSNLSDRPQRIWREWCSWGYYALSFELSDENGKTWTVKKKPRDWTMNNPDYWTVEPHECLVLDVHFADTNIWEGFPRPSGVSQAFTMRAVFEIRPDKESHESAAWTGRAVSKADQYVFYR